MAIPGGKHMTTARDPDRTVTVAVLQAGQAHSRHGNPGPEANWALLARLAGEAAAASPDLIVWPEYAISGWPYPPEEEINALAESIPGDGPWYRRYVSLAREIAVPLLCWLVEADDGARYNACFLLDAHGALVGKYRKVHANLGEQTWWGWSQGQAFAPIEHDGVRYGTSICADMWFPETTRCNELLGADLVIHQSIADDMGHLIPARAFDSGLPIVAAIYNGGSYAVDAQGELLDKLPAETPGWKAFQLEPFRVRTARKYGGLWIPRLGNRNLRVVGAYGVLVDPATRPPWTAVFLDEEGRPQTRDQLLRRFHGRYDADDPALYHAPLVAFDPPWTSPYTVDPQRPYQLVNREGRHLFILNKTAWAYFACRDPALTLDRAAALGANVLRVALEGTPYLDVLGFDMWPWGGSRREPDWGRFDEAYWDRVEERVRLAGERGIGLDVVLYFTLHPGAGQVEAQRPYWEQALRRLGTYANVLTWEIANEYVANEAFQDAAGSFFQAHDPYRRPVCTSDGTTDDAVWPDKPWIDLAVVHTCTSSTERHGLREWYLAVARNARAYGKPAFCNESGRERRHGNDDGVHRRKQGWLWCASGGFWTWHSWDGCEGIDDPDYVAPGQEFLRPMAEFYRALPFWRLAPNHTVLTCDDGDLIVAALAAPDRATVAGYLCTPRTGAHAGPLTAGLRLPGGEYRLTLLRPVDLSIVETRTHRSPGLREQVPVQLPAFTDDLAIEIECLRRATQTRMPGTG
jgi:predicted amidohydrolase